MIWDIQGLVLLGSTLQMVEYISKSLLIKPTVMRVGGIN